MGAMTDNELIGYAEIHCKTERAMFNANQIDRMLELAGDPPGFVTRPVRPGWYSVHENMEELCKLARERQKAAAQPAPVGPPPTTTTTELRALAADMMASHRPSHTEYQVAAALLALLDAKHVAWVDDLGHIKAALGADLQPGDKLYRVKGGA